MEAPSPFTKPTPNITKEENITIISNQINLKLENEDYKMYLIIILKENIEYLRIKIENFNNIYQIDLSLNQLKEISKTLRFFDSLNEILNFIENKGKNNEIELLKNLNNVKIKFKIGLPNGSEDNVLIELNKKELNDKEIIKQLTSEVKMLKDKSSEIEKIWLEIKNLKNENNIIKEEIKNLKNENNIIKEENKNLKNENNNIKEEIKQLTNKYNQVPIVQNITKNNNLIDSRIINYNEIEFIINYLKNNDILFKKNGISFNLLYRASRDGDNTQTIHNKCDSKKNILFILLTEQNNIIGGYSQIGWETRNKAVYPIDNKSFLFSITKNKIYPAIEGKNIVCWIESDCGLCFASSIGMKSKFMTEQKCWIYSSICSYFSNLSSNVELNGGKLNMQNDFKLLEYEVYQLV